MKPLDTTTYSRGKIRTTRDSLAPKKRNAALEAAFCFPSFTHRVRDNRARFSFVPDAARVVRDLGSWVA